MSRRNPLNERNTKAAQKEQTPSSQRSSAARLRPKRRAADSVRIVDAQSKSAGASKAQQKAQREKQRAEENRIYTVAALLLESSEQYKKFKRIFWVLLVAAMLITISTFALNYIVPSDHVSRLVVIGVAYALVFAAFLIDVLRVRPVRKAARLKAAKMSKRQMNELLEAHYVKLEEKKAQGNLLDKVKAKFR